MLQDRLHVLAFATRDELTRYFGRLDRYLSQRLGTDYARRRTDLELWANTDPSYAGRETVPTATCGPCLFANDVLLELIRWGRLGRASAYTVPREALPKNAWAVLGPHAEVAHGGREPAASGRSSVSAPPQSPP
jgi:hypothetical protein